MTTLTDTQKVFILSKVNGALYVEPPIYWHIPRKEDTWLAQRLKKVKEEK